MELMDNFKCRQSDRKKPLTHGWIVVPSKSHPDRVYFFNTVTKCSTWENPCEGNDSISLESPSQSSPSVGLSSTFSSHKSLVTYNAPNLPVETNERLQTATKDNNNHNSNDKGPKNSVNIEDFDDSDHYFESDSSNKCIVSSTHSGDVHSPFGSFDNSVADGNTKELSRYFSSRQERTPVKKSLALSDIEDNLFCSIGIEMSKNNNAGKNWYVDVTPSAGGSMVRKNGFKTPEVQNKESSYKSSKSSKRRNKKSPGSSETQTKCDIPKLSKQHQFKRRDKTPAQTRLLKLREKNAELLREYEVSEKRHKTPTTSNESRARNVSQNLEFKGPSENVTVDKNDLNANDASAIEDYMEEMDWEPTSEELDAQNINVLCEKMDITRESSSDLFSSMSHSVTEVANLSYSWILVLDTNILVSCLSFIKELRDTGFPGLGYPVLYIPWRVLQELDHLKDSKIEGTYSYLSANVRKAISYLNDNFKSLHPRCIGQSFEDFKEMVDADTVAPDDEILETCLRLQKLQPGKKLTLLTNDKNLESKALVSRIETYSKEEFQKKYFKSGTHPRIPTDIKKTQNIGSAEIDNFVCELKCILKNFVPYMVETEMKLAFDKDWTKLAFKKPPWTLQDSFDCLFKHWRSVFFAIFSKEVCVEAERLYHRLFKKEPGTIDEIGGVIDTTQKLLFKMKSSVVSSRPYSGELQSTMTKLSKLLEEVVSKSSQVDDQIRSLNSDDRRNGFSLGETSYSENASSWETERIKTILKEIWNSLNNFCFTLSNLTFDTNPPNGSLMLETRMKLSQTLGGLRELIFSIDKILEIQLRDINECHPIIIHLANFLIKLLPSMESQMKTHLPKLLVVVCTETEGRSLLHGSVKDFRDFAENLTKASGFFERGSPSF